MKLPPNTRIIATAPPDETPGLASLLSAPKQPRRAELFANFVRASFLAEQAQARWAVLRDPQGWPECAKALRDKRAAYEALKREFPDDFQ